MDNTVKPGDARTRLIVQEKEKRGEKRGITKERIEIDNRGAPKSSFFSFPFFASYILDSFQIANRAEGTA